MFLGYFQLGDMVPISVWTLDGSKAPSQPDDVPVARVYDSSGDLVLSQKLPVVDSADVDGFFQHRINLDQLFSTGYHSVIVHYAVDSTDYAEVFQFEILPGGNQEGNGISMHFFKQQAADFVLLQTDRGSLKRLRNPKVRGAT